MLLCLVCLTLLASFFLPSHLSFKNMCNYIHVYTCMYMQCNNNTCTVQIALNCCCCAVTLLTGMMEEVKEEVKGSKEWLVITESSIFSVFHKYFCL